MIPLALDPACARIGLAGAGMAARRRLAALRGAGAAPVLFAADDALAGEPGALPHPPGTAVLGTLQLLYIAGLAHEQARELAEAAREAGVLVNTEDIPELCDFHAVAEIRRGGLLLTVSTGGAAPGLAALIRAALEELFPPVWAARLAEIASLRERWRAEGLEMAETRAQLAALLRERGWLPPQNAEKP